MRTGSIIALAALIYVAFVGPLHSSAGVTENSAAAVAQADSASLNASTDKTLSSKPQAGQRHAFAFPLSNRFEPLLLLLLGSVLLGVGTSVRVAARRVHNDDANADGAREKEPLPFLDVPRTSATDLPPTL